MSCDLIPSTPKLVKVVTHRLIDIRIDWPYIKSNDR